uniref:Uncharacterized protein n=1 Tax=Amphimedon queenslandica TaxID=400682 RepID=A0A1X7UXR1_AMPQE
MRYLRVPLTGFINRFCLMGLSKRRRTSASSDTISVSVKVTRHVLIAISSHPTATLIT